jgi:diguanylate cyclase (GGDEF)-like protein/PAS domain S-box-containing protein
MRTCSKIVVEILRKEDAVPQKILLIEDDSADAQTILDLVTSSDGDGDLVQVEWVRRCSEGLQRLAKENDCDDDAHDITAVIVDLTLSDSTGIETFEQIYEAAPHIPILILSGSGAHDEDVAKLAVRRGAQDYLLKTRLDAYSLAKALGTMVERSATAETLFAEQERVVITLNSIGEAVMSTDANGYVRYLNAVAETLTGWSRAEAIGRPIEEVLRIVDETTRQTLPDPMALAIREDKTTGRTPNCLLIRRDGRDAAIEHSAAPIHDRRGAVTGAVIVFHDVSTARAMSLRMSYLAQHDALTDLPNRMLLNEQLTETMALARRHERKLAVLLIDLDRFKRVNDSLGYAMGDRVLKSVATRLQTCVRASDTVSRQGGDEFVVVLTELNQLESAAVSAERILAALRAPFRIDHTDLHLSASIGIVTYPDDGANLDMLMRNANFAMSHAKNSGRDNHQFFQLDMNVRAAERQSLENGLRHAVARRQLQLYYQPKMNLATNAIVGVEALIRWHHPQRGLVPPAQFIPVAEECGLIVPIGRWILREACRQAYEWQKAGLPAVRVAINISAVELHAKDFVAAVASALRDTGLEPHYLELELTETFLMQDLKNTADVLEGIRGIGVALALDDFGTGYSSLSYLRRFPIDTLKVDRSFIHELTTNADDASIVSALINMGKSLHMQVVAEGIETAEQLQLLREQNCPEGQGYYFSRPVVAVEFAKLLAGGFIEAAAA